MSAISSICEPDLPKLTIWPDIRFFCGRNVMVLRVAIGFRTRMPPDNSVIPKYLAPTLSVPGIAIARLSRLISCIRRVPG
ncbi:MAG: hypothetical protein WCG06_01840, partial [Candidatus Omnitrophota bacterium]